MPATPRPKRSGTIFRYAPPKPGEELGHYVVRCSAPDGTRPLFHLDPSPESEQDRQRALDNAKTITDELFTRGEGAAPRNERKRRAAEAVDDCATWFETWINDRKARGYTSTRDNEAHYREHIVPALGPKHVRHWTRDDMRGLSLALDRKVQAKALSWKTALNVWGTATKMCDDATESKNDELKCRDENPALRVRAPDRGEDPEAQFLYPSEFLKFVSCAEVPHRWRRLVAVAIYTYGRDGELRALLCRDADLQRQKIHFTKARNKRDPGVTTTKTEHNRTIPVEPTIAPLLAALKKERGDAAGTLLPEFPSERDMARGLRRWLLKAGVDRHELHHDTDSTAKLRFHDLRATGITWMAVRGDDPLKIQQRAGHTDFETTQRYIRLAEVHRDGFGKVFPALPAALLKPPKIARAVTKSATGDLSTGNYSGADGTRTRGLRRDRPAL